MVQKTNTDLDLKHEMEQKWIEIELKMHYESKITKERPKTNSKQAKN